MNELDLRRVQQGGQRFLTTEEVADICRAEPETVRYWRYAGTGPKSFRLPGSRRVLYDEADVASWIASAQGAA